MPFDRYLLNPNAFAPDVLASLKLAFDAAWTIAAGSIPSDIASDAARNHLALAIIRAATAGERDVGALKDAGLRALARIKAL